MPIIKVEGAAVTTCINRFDVQKFYVFRTECISVNSGENSDCFPEHHELVGFCNRSGRCSIRGSNITFK